MTIPNYVVVDEHMDTGPRVRPQRSSVAGTDTARAQRVIAPIGLHPGAQDYYARAGR